MKITIILILTSIRIIIITIIAIATTKIRIYIPPLVLLFIVKRHTFAFLGYSCYFSRNYRRYKSWDISICSISQMIFVFVVNTSTNKCIKQTNATNLLRIRIRYDFGWQIFPKTPSELWYMSQDHQLWNSFAIFLNLKE